MLDSVTVRNFKSLADVTVELGQFTVLIGSNGSGKSSFLQAIELLSWTVTHDSVNAALRQHHTEFRDLVYLQSPRATVTIIANLSLDVAQSPYKSIRFETHLTKRRYVYIDYEILQPVRPNKEGDQALPFLVASVSRSRTARDITGEKIVYDNVALGHSVLRDVIQSPSSSKRFPVLSEVARHFSTYVHYEIWGPETLRQPSSRPAYLPGVSRRLTLGKLGQNLPHMLYAIRQEQSRWAELLENVKIVYPNITNIRFRRGLEPGELGIVFDETLRTRKSANTITYRPTQMSDGFMRLLALLALRYQPTVPWIIGYEEPENGMHPAALEQCMRHLKAIAARGTQVVVTTHSPYLLNHLLEDEEEPRADLRLVFKDRAGRTSISPPDQSKIELARRQGLGVGELWGMLTNERELAQAAD